MHPGDQDIARAVNELADRLPTPLRPLAAVAFDYRWSWAVDGAAIFAAIEPERWARCGANPLRLLTETPSTTLAKVAADSSWLDRVQSLVAELAADRTRPCPAPWCESRPAAQPLAIPPISPTNPVAYCCAEFGIHGSLPIYSGGLGVLAGDILKEASDLAFPMVGVGLMYRSGYFHQHIDPSGLQHEYWIDADPERLPCAKVSDSTGQALRVVVPIHGEQVQAQVWRVDVGRVPLYLLDTDLPDNSQVGRWVTSRLYESNRAIRLAQYAMLGVGGLRALRAMGIEPAVYHFNEGHPVLGVAELLAQAQTGLQPDAAWQRVREQLVFTTHTPVAAGNETYSGGELLAALGPADDPSGKLSADHEQLLTLGRTDPAQSDAPVSLTVLALRASRHANGVSRRHGEVARAMWQSLYPGCAPDQVPIDHVTNGVHLPTWLQGPMRALLDHHLGQGWLERADDSATWAPVDDIPATELWAARCAARRQLVELISHRATSDRLRRGEPLAYAEAIGHGFDIDRLTIGFARRLATYKRLHLVALLPERAMGLIDGVRPVQFVFAGKAHPDDNAAKDCVRQVFSLKHAPAVAGRAAFLEDYDIPLAGQLVSGCDVWVNLPRPPQEASGTSGMKSCLGGGLQLSVLDGWWAEAFDGSNGWAINGDIATDPQAQDLRDAGALFDLLENEVLPMFHQRDDQGIPQRWVAMMRRSLQTNGPRFSAKRMLREYAGRIYPRH